MFLAGESRYKTVRGVVAEFCSRCQCVRTMEVVDHCKTFHVYLIPLGKGSVEFTSLQCVRCSAEFIYFSGNFNRVLSTAAARELTLAEIVRETAPRLLPHLPAEIPDGRRDDGADAAIMAEIVEEGSPGNAASPSSALPGATVEEQFEADPPSPPGGGDRRLKAAMASLLRFERNEEAREHLERLKSWPQLTAAERELALAEADLYLERESERRRLIEFGEAVSSSYPHNAGCLSGCASYMALLSVPLWWPAARSWLWIPLLIFCGLFVSLFPFALVQSLKRKRWCRRVLIPHAQVHGVPLRAFLDSLGQLDRHDRSLQENHRELIGDRKELRELLAKLDALPPASAPPGDPHPRSESRAPLATDKAPPAYPRKQAAARARSSDSLPESARLQRVIRRLNSLDHDPHAGVLLKELRAWDRLSEDERQRLLERAEDDAEGLLLRRHSELVYSAGTNCYPRRAGCLSALTILILGCIPAIWWPPARSAWPLMVVGSMVASLLVLWFVRRRRLVNWAHRVFLPEVQRQGVDFGLLANYYGDAVSDDPARSGPLSDDDKLRIAARIMKVEWEAGREKQPSRR